jgi:pimeloyl-ACP methyl ester carboxylesterase
MPNVDVNGAQLWVEESGAGPAVVFVHGGLGDSRLWIPVARLAEVDSDHYLSLREPEQVSELLLEFLTAAAAQ